MRLHIRTFLMAERPFTQYALQPLLLLAFRVYVGWAFFKDGTVKIQSWAATLSLFREEYAVPFFAPELAAALWTGIELTLPVLVAFGVLTRPAALLLFAFNLLAVISYPYLFTPAGAAGFLQHVIWGGMLLVLFVFGPGNLSCDKLCVSVLSPRATPRPQRLYHRHTGSHAD